MSPDAAIAVDPRALVLSLLWALAIAGVVMIVTTGR